MILTLLISVVIAALDFLFSFFDLVTELPFGMDEVLLSFMGYVHALIEVIPPLGTVWNVILSMLLVKLSLFLFPYLRWVVNLIRGAGS